MRCSGCGKDIPFTGQFCPYCQRDKSADQQKHTVSTVLALIGGVIGYVGGGFFYALAGTFVGGIVGLIATRNVATETGKASEVSGGENETLGTSQTSESLHDQESQSLYDVIGVSPTATHEDIEVASIRLAQELDPAKTPGNLHAALRFKEVEHAYEILGNPDTRRQYDEEVSATPEFAKDTTTYLESQASGPGQPNSAAKARNIGISLAVGMLLLLIIGGGILLRRSNPAPLTPLEAQQNQQKREDAEATPVLLEAVRNSFKDPESVKIRGMKEHHFFSTHTICGEIDARNGFGAYSGYRKFFARLNTQPAKPEDRLFLFFQPQDYPTLSEHQKMLTDNVLLSAMVPCDWN